LATGKIPQDSRDFQVSKQSKKQENSRKPNEKKEESEKYLQMYNICSLLSADH